MIFILFYFFKQLKMIENQNLDFSNNGMLNNRNSNTFKEVSVIHSKEKIINKKSTEKYFILYFSTIIFIYILFYINYLKTSNWYEENRHYINLRPISICNVYIENLEKCINETQKSAFMLRKDGDIYVYDTKLICKEDNDRLQSCFDKVQSFSQRCQIYLNDLFLCKNKTGSNINKCINNNMINCWRAYNVINMTKVYEDL